MTERVMNIEALQAYLATTFRTNQVRVCEADSGLLIEPIKDDRRSSADRLRGMFKDSDGRSVERFLERKHADKELDL
jgi:hypothetical protein